MFLNHDFSFHSFVKVICHTWITNSLMNFLQAGISGSLVEVGNRTFKRNSRNICKSWVKEVMNWHYVSDVHLVQNEFLVLWVLADQPLIGFLKALKAARREALPERKRGDHHC